MMRVKLFAVLLPLALAACGTDGEPVQPEGKAVVSVGDNGVRAGAVVGVSQGPISIFLGL